MAFTRTSIMAIALCAGTAAQAQTANLTVTGAITPGACAVTLGLNGNVDYGNIAKDVVMTYPVVSDHFYQAAGKAISMTVVCAAPIALALSWADNRASSLTPVDTDDPARFGLGTTTGGNVGHFRMNHRSLMVATTPAGTTVVPSGYIGRPKGTSDAWSDESGTVADADFTKTREIAFKTAVAETVPPAIALISGNIMVEAFFDKRVVDIATTQILLDGSATVSIVYV